MTLDSRLVKVVYLLICTLSVLAIQNAQAQVLRSLIVEEGDGPPIIQTEHPDKATVIIQANIANLRVESSLIIIEDRSTPANGRYEFVVEPRRQQLIVNAEGFTEAIISIPSLQEREFKYYTISPSAPQYPLSIVASINGADAFANDSLLGQTPITARLEAGRYTIRIEEDGYAPASRVIDLQEASRLTFDLQPQLFELTVTSNPGDAQIRVNNVEQGRTSSILELRRGIPYTIEIIKDGYYPWKKEVTIERNEVLSADLVSTAESAPSTLIVSSIPTGARVFVDNRFAGSAPMEQVVRPGSYSVRLEAEGFDTATETVTIAEGEEQRLQFTLKPVEQRVSITSQPAGATVLINGFEAGTTPYSGSVSPGFTTIRLELDGYDAVEEMLDVGTDPLDLNYTLSGSVLLVTDAGSAAYIRDANLSMQDNLIIVDYNLSGDPEVLFTTALEISTDGGNTFRALREAEGDLGKGIQTDGDKRITWAYSMQYPGGFPESGIQLQVTAKLQRKSNNRMLYIIGGAVLAGGGGAILALSGGGNGGGNGGGDTIANGPPGRPPGQ